MSQSSSLSFALQDLAAGISEVLKGEVGEDIAFVLICQTNGVAQYVSNTDRQEGKALVESLLERWKAGRADIPAHYNPDIKK